MALEFRVHIEYQVNVYEEVLRLKTVLGDSKEASSPHRS
jgi:hypothetical protein